MKRSRNKRKRIKQKFNSYKKLIRKDEDWDYGFMLALEKHKLQRMLKWMRTRNYCQVDESARFIIRDLQLALRLMKISSGDDVHVDFPPGYEDLTVGLPPEGWWKHKYPYVNLKNAKRFLPKYVPSDTLPPYGLREQKAWFLYNKLRAYRMRTWWD